MKDRKPLQKYDLPEFNRAEKQFNNYIFHGRHKELWMIRTSEGYEIFNYEPELELNERIIYKYIKNNF